MTKEQNKEFLRICKSVDFLKLARILRDNNISASAVSRFINYDDRDEFISNDKLNELTEQIYSCCLFIVDMYDDINKHGVQKVA